MVPLEKRLSSFISSTGSDFNEIKSNMHILTLRCAFEWLASTEPRTWELVKDAICIELEVKSVNWHELISSEWDFGLWCLWIYIVAALQFFKKTRTPVDALTERIELLLQ